MAAVVSFGLERWITATADRFPEKACFLYGDGSIHTFAEINSRVNCLADALASGGIRPGDRVAILALDSHRYAEVVLAALKVGAVFMPLNWRLQAAEVKTLVSRGRPSVIFHDGRYYSSLLDEVRSDPGSSCWLVDFDDGGPTGYESLVATGRDVEFVCQVGDGALFGLAFTSGTTGLPKGVMQSRRMIKSMVMSSLLEYRARPGDVRYSASPLFHVTGIVMMLMGVAYGYTCLITPQFDPAIVARYLLEDRLTACFLVPTMISMLLQRSEVLDGRYDRLELIMYGAAPMSPGLLKRAMDTFDCDFLNLFGAGTEAGLQAILSAEDHRRALEGREELLGSIGKPPTGVEMRLTDDDMCEVPEGEIGEITTRSDTVMDGYLDMPEQTKRSLRDGWFRAGDLAYRGDDGYLYLAGRKNDMIIRGGENIYPIEIESVLHSHPSVAEVAVVGVPDEHWGETVRAWIIPIRGRSCDPEEMSAWCRSRLASYKVPTDYRLVESLPMNASGKILKAELRARK